MKNGKTSNHAEWLLGELEELEMKGIVTADEAKRLSDYYSPSVRAGGNYLHLLLLTVGVLFIVGGVILFFSYIWDSLPKIVRTVVASAPLCGSLSLSFFCVLNRKSSFWREAAATLLFLSLGLAFSIVPRNYGITIRQALYAKYVLAFSLPFIYLLNSAALCALYSLSLFVLAPEPSPTRLLYLAAVVPFLCVKTRAGESRSLLFRCVSLIPMLFFVFAAPEHAMNAVFLFSAMTAIGGSICEKEQSFLCSPYVWFGGAFLFLIYGCECAFAWQSGIHRDFAKAGGFEAFVCFCWLLPAAVYALFAVRCTSNAARRHLLLLGGFLVLAVLRFAAPDSAKLIYRVFCGYYLFASIAFAYLGLRAENLLLFNAGAVSAAIFFLARFLDADIAIGTRSAAFIVTGIFFIALNVFLRKFFRKQETAKAD